MTDTQVQPLPVDAAHTQEALDGQVVVLALRTVDGQLFHFALATPFANDLKNSMTRSIAAARRQSRQAKP